MHNSFDLKAHERCSKFKLICWTWTWALCCVIFINICNCDSKFVANDGDQIQAAKYSGSASVDGSKMSNVVPTKLTKDPDYESETDPKVKDQDDDENIKDDQKTPAGTGRKETRKQELERKRKQKKEEKKNMMDWAKWVIPLGVLVLLGVVFTRELISRYRRSH